MRPKYKIAPQQDPSRNRAQLYIGVSILLSFTNTINTTMTFPFVYVHILTSLYLCCAAFIYAFFELARAFAECCSINNKPAFFDQKELAISWDLVNKSYAGEVRRVRIIVKCTEKLGLGVEFLENKIQICRFSIQQCPKTVDEHDEQTVV